MFSFSTISVLILYYSGVPLVWAVILVGIVDLIVFAVHCFKTDSGEKKLIISSIITNTKEIDDLIMRENQRNEITARGLYRKDYGLTDYEKRYLPKS
jgi:hypothetical protein